MNNVEMFIFILKYIPRSYAICFSQYTYGDNIIHGAHQGCKLGLLLFILYNAHELLL